VAVLIHLYVYQKGPANVHLNKQGTAESTSSIDRSLVSKAQGRVPGALGASIGGMVVERCADELSVQCAEELCDAVGNSTRRSCPLGLCKGSPPGSLICTKGPPLRFSLDQVCHCPLVGPGVLHCGPECWWNFCDVR
jgi:hypothetical protein